jgi:hypothetical protein
VSPAEGWQADKHPSQRVYHYIRNGMALCRKLGFYSGELMPEPENASHGKQDCAQCVRKLAKPVTVASPRPERSPGND